MKKIFTLTLLLFFVNYSNFAQTVQASLGSGTALNSVKIYIMSDTTLTSNISTLQFNIAVPTDITVSAPIVVSSANSISWTVSPSRIEGGYNNFALTNAVVPVKFSLTANTEFEVLELQFPNTTNLPDSVSLVTLPDGGKGRLALFYSSGTPRSDGSNLYYARTGLTYNTVINNNFSYDTTGKTKGTSTSTATLILRALPIKLSSFTISQKNNTPILNWTSQNQDATSDHFEIERSSNGSDFDKIASVNVTSKSSDNYAYNDNSLDISGTVYYRLKMVDKDGKFTYSDIRTVQINKTFAVNIYPNPVRDFTKLNITLENAAFVKVTVNDILGNQIQQMQYNGQKGLNEKSLNLSSLSAGSYMIKVQAGNNTKVVSVIKN